MASAISELRTVTGAVLYASSVMITDEYLSGLSVNEFNDFTYSIPSELIRHRLAGHTMVWNEALQKSIRSTGSLSAWSHDQHVVLAALLANAPLLLDKIAYVKHRRLESSVTPGGGSAVKRLRHEAAILLNSNRKMDRPAVARALLLIGANTLDSDTIAFLRLVENYRKKWSDWLKLFNSPMLTCGLFLGDVEAKISLLIRRF